MAKRANTMTAEHQASVLEAVYESDEAIQEMMDAFFDISTDEQIAAVLTKTGYDDFDEDDE